MTTLQRLKFAYARGARIQFAHRDTWRTETGSPYWEWWPDLRIHPDDAALEYGPISTGILAMALDERNSQSYCHETWQHNCYQFAADWLRGENRDSLYLHYMPEDYSEDYFSMSLDEWRMLLLFYAEAMADAGL